MVSQDSSEHDGPADGVESDDSSESAEDDSWEPDRPTRMPDGTIVVPTRMYKGITVFSTLLATVLVVLGFFFFDAATQPRNLIRRVVVGIFEAVGLGLSAGVYDVTFGLLGIAAILVGAGSYILGSRFKAADMVTGEPPVDDASVDEKA